MDTPPLTPEHAELLETYLDHERRVTGLAAETLRHRRLYLSTYARFLATAAPGAGLLAGTRQLVLDFLAAEHDRGMTTATRSSQLTAIRRLHAWARLVGRCASDPTAGLSGPKVVRGDIQVYRPAEVATILAHTGGLAELRGRLRDTIVHTLRFTGMRSIELRTLRLDHLDLAAGRAMARAKGGRLRPVVVPDTLIAHLRGYLDVVRPQLPESPLVLVNPHHANRVAEHGFGPEAIYREVELAGRDAGVAGRHHPHRWRHTYATELLRRGVDVTIVQRLLGHRSLSTTLAYTHLVTDDLKDAVDRVW